MFKKKSWPGWTELGLNVYKRELAGNLTLPVPGGFPGALGILIPDLARMGRIPKPQELIFFDLETTGLSTGAGTLAFLAAFGRFVNGRLKINQYLLLDYPGECDFMEVLLKEFQGAPVVVSYNGKCFDSQILKTRCLMNGIKAPDYSHADLLHPARRLWKRLLPNCSQATIEVSILDLDRGTDISGAQAPDIWFSFLRNGDNRELLLVCDHNVRDIEGLAALFLALADIAARPLKSRFRYDPGALAISWWRSVRKHDEVCSPCPKTGRLLLEKAARNGCFRSALALAIDAEWRLRDLFLALTYTNCALGIPEISESFRESLEKRRLRLESKLNGTFTVPG